MRCPSCGSLDDKVIESRTMTNGDSIRRRRECLACHYRFTSYEKVEEKPLMVVKRSGRREPFDPEKLAKGIERALEKRPVPAATTDEIVSKIEEDVYELVKTSREIPTSTLGELVLKKLNTIDKVAYIRFASVYKHFENLDEFIKEVKKLEKNEV